MSILFGHPTGNPNSHHAALAHFNAGRLEAFCVPWLLTGSELRVLDRIPGFDSWRERLRRRSFPGLADAPLIQGKTGEMWRMARRILFPRWTTSEKIAYEANDWLMRTM